MVEISGKMWSTREGNGKPLQHSYLENSHEQYEKVERYDTRRIAPQVERCPECYWGKSIEQLLIAPERMDQQSQSRNDAQLWMCLVVKVKSDAVKNNIA